MKYSEVLKKAIKDRKQLKITMYNENTSDTDIYTFYEGKYRDKLGIGFEIEDLLDEINNETWLKIEVSE